MTDGVLRSRSRSSGGGGVSRREALAALIALGVAPESLLRAAPAVTTLIGNGVPGLSDTQVNNPYGVTTGPGGLYFCDLDNQRIRLLDVNTRRTVVVAGSGERGYSGDGGPATMAALNMPHEVVFDRQDNIYIAERDSHVVRRIAAGTAVVSTIAGTGTPGFSGDGGPANQAQLRQPHSIVVDADNGLLICDIGNQRIRRVDLATGVIATWAGTGAAQPTPDGAPRTGTPLQGPRTFAFAPDGTLYLALREGNAVLKLDRASDTWTRIAGAGGRNGYAGDGGPARDAQLGGPKGLAFDATQNALFIADTENHVIRRVDLASGIITTALGTGVRGDGPETSPAECKLARPHGLCVDPRSGVLYVADSEAHRIRILAP